MRSETITFFMPNGTKVRIYVRDIAKNDPIVCLTPTMTRIYCRYGDHLDVACPFETAKHIIEWAMS